MLALRDCVLNDCQAPESRSAPKPRFCSVSPASRGRSRPLTAPSATKAAVWGVAFVLGEVCFPSYRGRVNVVGCLPCDLIAGRQHLPGGVILEADGWRVEHCVGPLGVGTLLLKPVRHVTRVAELTAAEAAAQGSLIHRCAAIVDTLLAPAQTYVCLWSHAGGQDKTNLFHDHLLRRTYLGSGS
jgi:diadenosine tetraphosphate (Ap4A) HIT family hydrolase